MEDLKQIQFQQIIQELEQNNSFITNKLVFHYPEDIKLILLNSEEGLKLLKESKVVSKKIGYYFRKQFTNTTCGISSSALTLSILFDNSDYTENWILQNTQIPHKVEKEGLNMQQCYDIVQDIFQNKLNNENYKISQISSSDITEQQFTEYIIESINNQIPVICNYDMGILVSDQLALGHFSPVVAYHQQAKKFLILDPWPGTPLIWVDYNKLYEASDTKDSGNGLTRGLILINKK